jgi:diguanylate cyclase
MAGEADIERTFSIGERALDFMRTYGSPATPRAYEVWYTYVAAERPHLNDALKRIVTERGAVTGADIEALHRAHLSPQRLGESAEKASSSVLVEIEQVMEMIDLALGTTERYGESLQAMSAEMSGGVDRKRIREILESLVVATKDVTATNRTLEARLRETRGEIETLRERLESARIETLTDPLTGIANRKHFEEMLAKTIDQSVVEGTPMALVVIDIDHFKRFNDTFGHLTGDQVLRLVAQTMREQVKSKAMLARFGGEEFAIILPDASLDAARTAAERVRVAVMGRELVKRSTGESLGKVTISLGVAALRRGDTAPAMLERADQCMLAAKRAGRNRTLSDAEYDPQSDLSRFSDVA